MIGIKPEDIDEFLDTSDDTSIEVTLENPICAGPEQLSPGSYSLPFGLPGGDDSPKNSAALNHPDVIENATPYTVKNSSLFMDGVLFKKGKLKTEGIDNSIKSYFLFGLIALGDDIKTIGLRQIFDEAFVTGATLTKKIYAKYLNLGIRKVIANGKEYSAVTWPLIVNAINADGASTAGTEKFVPYAEFVDVGGPDTPLGVVAPYIIVKLVKYTDPITVVDCTDVTQELSVLIDDNTQYYMESDIYSDYYNAFETFMEPYITGDYPSDAIRFPCIFNAGLYADDIKETELINGVGTGGFILNDPNISGKNRNSIQPFLRLKYVLEKIADYFDVDCEGDFLEWLVTHDRVIDNSYALDLVQKYMGVNNELANKFAFWRTEFNIKDLLPDTKLVDFLKGICDFYNVACYINESNGKLRFQFREPIAKSIEYDDITMICSRVRKIANERIEGYQLTIAKEANDLFSLEETFVNGNGELDIPISCGRLQQTLLFSQDTGIITGPRLKRMQDAKFSLRVFNYDGIADSGSFDYPKASTEDTLQDIHDSFHKYWLLYRKNKLVIGLGVQWELRQLLRFNWELKRRFDRSNFLVKSIKVKLTHRGVMVSEVELITMK